MITLAQLGLDGLRHRLEQQDRDEMTTFSGQTQTDFPTILPGPLGKGGAFARKADAKKRILIEQELHRELISAEVHRLYKSEDGRRLVGGHVRTGRNVLKRTANALSVVYEREPIRTFGRGGSKKMEKAWTSAVLGEAELNLNAARFAKMAWITNVVHVIPQVVNFAAPGQRQDKRLVFESILPHAADVIFDPGDRQPSILVYLSDGDGWSRVAVDNERFLYLDDRYNLVREVIHGYRDNRGRPMQPWTQWRVRPRMRDEDYWKRGEGKALVDATLAVGVVAAAMYAIRQNSNRKMPVLIANNLDEDIPPGQALTGEHPTMLRKGVFQAVDLITPVKEFIEQMSDEQGEVAETYGVPVGVIDVARSTDRWAEFQAIARRRDQQVKHLRRADLETQVKAAIIMRAEGHPATRDVDPARLEKAVQVKFQTLTFLERPRERLEFYEKAISLGLMDQVLARMLENPDESFDQAEKAVRETIDRRNEFAGLLAERNLPADASQDGDSLVQLQGRLGGMTRNSNLDGNDERDQRDQRPAG